MLLDIRDLRTTFRTAAGDARAVDGVSLQLDAGETLGVVGESGSGKTVTAMSILGLLPMPPAQIESGRIEWQGEDLLKVSSERRRKVRGGEIAMIFQDPLTALNPVHRVHNPVRGRELDAEVLDPKEGRLVRRHQPSRTLGSITA